MAIIPEQFMNAVVAIGNNQFDANGNRSWIGSGFIVCRKERQNSSLLTYYIVTNKHVIVNLRQSISSWNWQPVHSPKNLLIPFILRKWTNFYRKLKKR